MYIHYKNIGTRWGALSLHQLEKALENETHPDIPTIERLASSEYPPAVYLIGEMYYYALGNYTRNVTYAYTLVKQAANNEYPQALALLTFMHSSGIGPKRADPAKAAVYAYFAMRAKTVFGSLFHINQLSPKNVTKHKERMQLLAQYSHYIALCQENNRFKDKEIIQLDHFLKLPPKDVKDEHDFEYTQYCAELGDERAQIDLANTYRQGLHGKEKDLAKAKELYEGLPENDEANMQLGSMYYSGEGVEKNRDLAEKYTRKALDLSTNSVAHNVLGLIEADKGNTEEGYKHIELAANGGNLGASYNIGLRLISNGTDPDRGISLINLAAEHGVYLAQHQRVSFMEIGYPQYMPRLSAHYYFSLLHKGDWTQMTEFAEKAYRNKDYVTAFLIYLELGHMNSKEASENAITMAARWKSLTGNEFPYLDRIPLSVLSRNYRLVTDFKSTTLFNINRIQAKRNVYYSEIQAIQNKSQSYMTHAYLACAEYSMEHNLFDKAMGNLSMAVIADRKSFIHVITWIPKLMQVLFTKLAKNQSLNGMTKDIMSLIELIFSPLAIIFSTMLLAWMTRKRVAYYE